MSFTHFCQPVVLQHLQQYYDDGLCYNNIEVKYINDASLKLENEAISQHTILHYKILFGYNPDNDTFLTVYTCDILKEGKQSNLDVIIYHYRVTLDDIDIQHIDRYYNTHYRQSYDKLLLSYPNIIIFEQDNI
jgi:hypothetical protein